MVALLIFGVGALAIAAYSSGQKSGVDAAPPRSTDTPGGDRIVAMPTAVSPKPAAALAVATSTMPPATSLNAVLERKRIIVRRGFEAAVLTRQKRLAAAKKSETNQATLNAVAKQFRAKGIVLEKPDPNLAFWKLSEKQISDMVANAVNTVSGFYA